VFTLKNADFIGGVGKLTIHDDDGAKMKRFRAAADAHVIFAPPPHSQKMQDTTHLEA
jgi:hypothetical protein